MEGIPLALDAERSPMLELLVIGNLECIKFVISVYFYEEIHWCTQKKVLFEFKKSGFNLISSIKSKNTLRTNINLFDFKKSPF